MVLRWTGPWGTPLSHIVEELLSRRLVSMRDSGEIHSQCRYPLAATDSANTASVQPDTDKLTSWRALGPDHPSVPRLPKTTLS